MGFSVDKKKHRFEFYWSVGFIFYFQRRLSDMKASSPRKSKVSDLFRLYDRMYYTDLLKKKKKIIQCQGGVLSDKITTHLINWKPYVVYSLFFLV